MGKHVQLAQRCSPPPSSFSSLSPPSRRLTPRPRRSTPRPRRHLQRRLHPLSPLSNRPCSPRRQLPMVRSPRSSLASASADLCLTSPLHCLSHPTPQLWMVPWSVTSASTLWAWLIPLRSSPPTAMLRSSTVVWPCWLLLAGWSPRRRISHSQTSSTCPPSCRRPMAAHLPCSTVAWSRCLL